ncbi:hypothetical protein OC846_004224 [Tilletia horrida]|uniref:Uncharacterized protein n=1 Tax=Tilletia horrida TaxID=155126 RepID=A0AAN6GMM7_9BASI|nr:hypothetical protein OC845_005398 [Tilletia horrida]KAK0549067.1 hypothetical protein OC846_004224 [Tilletia horrida]KAK0564652.1 hypothetical protein OC861_004181 [Tilletia horrida]
MNSIKRPTVTSARSSTSPSTLPPTPSKAGISTRSSPRKASGEAAASEHVQPAMTSPIAARTRGKNHRPSLSTASTTRLQLPRSINAASGSLQVPTTASPARPSSALGKRRTAERQDSEDSDEFFEDAQDDSNASKTSEFGVNTTTQPKMTTRAATAGGVAARRGNRLPGPAAAASRIRRLSTASISTTSRLARPSSSPTTVGSFLHMLRSHSPIKAAVAARPALAQSGGAGPSLDARTIQKSGLRPPGSGASSDAMVEVSSGSLPRPRKLSRPSTSLADSSLARAGPTTTTLPSASSSTLPKPRMGSAAALLAPGTKRQSLQMPSSASHVPPDSFAKNVRSTSLQQAHAPAQSSSISGSAPTGNTSTAATAAPAPAGPLPPSTSTFRFAFPSAARTVSNAAAHPQGSTPLRPGAGAPPAAVVHPAVASLRPHSLSTAGGGGGGGLTASGSGKLSKILLPTPDARERGKKRLSGMSLGSNTSMSNSSAILNASVGSSSSQSTAVTTAPYDEDKENRQGKNEDRGGRGGYEGKKRARGSKAGEESASTEAPNEVQVLEQLRALAQQSGLSLEHLRKLIDTSPENSHRLPASASSSSMNTSSAAASTSQMLLPSAHLHRGQSTPAVRNATSSRIGATAGSRNVGGKSANAAAAAFSPGNDSLRLDGGGMSPGVNVLEGEETIDLVNLSLSPPGSIGSPLAADDSILVTLKGGAGNQSLLGAGMDALMASTSAGAAAGFGSRRQSGQARASGGARADDVRSDGAESDVDMESPLMAIAALHGSSDPSSSESARLIGASDVKLVAGPLLPRVRQRSETRQSLGLEHALGPMLEGEEEDALGLLMMPGSSPTASTTYTDARETVRTHKSSSDSTGTARGGAEPTPAPSQPPQQQAGRDRELSHSAEQAARVASLEAELAQAHLEAERLRDLHRLKLVEYEEALEEANRRRDTERGEVRETGDGALAAQGDEGSKEGETALEASSATGTEVRKLQARIETLRAEQARGRRLYESELAGLEGACAAANQRAIHAEAERAREVAQASERARLDEEARHALSEEAERAMMALVEEREAAKAEEAQLRARLEQLQEERSRADAAREGQLAEAEEALASAQAEMEELGHQVAEMMVDSGEAAKREAGLKRELVAQERVVEEAWSSRRLVLGQTAALAWGDLADYGRNELLLLDGKADMCHFLLAQLDLWDGMLQKCYPSGSEPQISPSAISTAILKAA